MYFSANVTNAWFILYCSCLVLFDRAALVNGIQHRSDRWSGLMLHIKGVGGSVVDYNPNEKIWKFGPPIQMKNPNARAQTSESKSKSKRQNSKIFFALASLARKLEFDEQLSSVPPSLHVSSHSIPFWPKPAFRLARSTGSCNSPKWDTFHA